MYDLPYDLKESMMEIQNESTFVVDSLGKSEPEYQNIIDASGLSDEAILIYTWVIYGVLCPGIDIFGVVTNILNIICFIKQEFKDSINISLFGMKFRNHLNQML